MKPQLAKDAQVKLAWAAGFIDGEGCLYLKPYKRQHQPKVVVGNTNLPALETLQEIFGGTIYTRSMQAGARRTVYCWEATGGIAVKRVLEGVIPYLIVKREEADVLLGYVSRLDSKQGGKRVRLTDEELQIRTKISEQLSALKRVSIIKGVSE